MRRSVFGAPWMRVRRMTAALPRCRGRKETAARDGGGYLVDVGANVASSLCMLVSYSYYI